MQNAREVLKDMLSCDDEALDYLLSTKIDMGMAGQSFLNWHGRQPDILNWYNEIPFPDANDIIEQGFYLICNDVTGGISGLLRDVSIEADGSDTRLFIRKGFYRACKKNENDWGKIKQIEDYMNRKFEVIP